MKHYFYRIKHFEEILSNEIIDINSLRKLAFNGNHIFYTNLLINLLFLLTFNYKFNYKHYSIFDRNPRRQRLTIISMENIIALHSSREE